MSHCYRLHGLNIQSAIELDATQVPEPAQLDWQISETEPGEIGASPPPGEILLERRFANGWGYALVDTGRYEILRYFSMCDFFIFPDRKRIEVSLGHQASLGLAALFLTGTVFATILVRQGACVLHSSAVTTRGVAVAFLGNSGTGKSTLAALACGYGCSLLTDDALRVECSGADILCHPGTTQIRLRDGSAPLAADFPSEIRTTTVDLRTAVRLGTGKSRVRLRTIIIPVPSRKRSDVNVQRLGVGESMLYLHGHSRSAGWLAHSIVQHQFETLTKIVQRVPVFKAEIPWGPPFSPNLIKSLFRSIGH